jgi:lactam utilization protein B
MVIMAAGGAVSWQSKRQVTCAVSTSEAEYQAMSTAAKEVQWIKQLREDMGHNADMVVLYGDNTGALAWTKDWKLEVRAKHIDVMHHYIRELVLSKRLEVRYVNTAQQL